MYLSNVLGSRNLQQLPITQYGLFALLRTMLALTPLLPRPTASWHHIERQYQAFQLVVSQQRWSLSMASLGSCRYRLCVFAFAQPRARPNSSQGPCAQKVGQQYDHLLWVKGN